MKYLILLIFLSAQVLAGVRLRMDYSLGGLPFEFSKKTFSDHGDLNIGYFVTCRPEKNSLCQSTCGAQTCLVNTDSCSSCVSSRNLNVFAIFNDFNKLFSLSQSTVDWIYVFEKIKNSGARLIDENTILNLFEDTQSDEKYEIARQRFISSCPAGTKKAFLMIDNDLNPLLYVCKGDYGQIVYGTEWNAEFSK